MSRSRALRILLAGVVTAGLAAATPPSSSADPGADGAKGSATSSPSTGAKPKPKPKYQVSITTPGEVAWSARGKAKGKVLPPAPGAKVKLQARSGSSWITIGKDKLGKKSTFSISFTGDRLGQAKLRVTKAASPRFRAGTSRTRTVRVRNAAARAGYDVVTSSYAEHVCSRRATGALKCWGDNDHGELGDGNSGTTSASAVSATISGVVSVSPGEEHTCVVTQPGGLVRCVGENDYGKLGNGTTDPSTAWVTVVGVSDAIAVSVNEDFSCALLRSGGVRCWGVNEYGTLGDGTNVERHTAVAVVGITNAVQISAGEYHACALLDTRQVKCWGYNGYGELGDGTLEDRSVPVTTVALAGVAEVAAGSYHTCARLVSGQARCWGYALYGQLGDGTITDSAAPRHVLGLSGVSDISAGDYHSCAVVSGGTVRCWGYNSDGELGNGTETQSNVPVTMTGVTGAQRVTAGYYVPCVQVASTRVRCAGDGSYGSLGDGQTDDRSTATEVLGLS